MSGIDAFQAIKQLRDMGVKIPILVFTEKINQVEIEKCYHDGMDDYIIKPFEKQVLLEKSYYF